MFVSFKSYIHNCKTSGKCHWCKNKDHTKMSPNYMITGKVKVFLKNKWWKFIYWKYTFTWRLKTLWHNLFFLKSAIVANRYDSHMYWTGIADTIATTSGVITFDIRKTKKGRVIKLYFPNIFIAFWNICKFTHKKDQNICISKMSTRAVNRLFFIVCNN